MRSPSRPRSFALALVLAVAGSVATSSAVRAQLPEAAEAPVPTTAPIPVLPTREPIRLGSPRATMETFLRAMNALWQRPGAWEAATACLDDTGLDPREARDRARNLYSVLNRIEEIDVRKLPDRADVEEDARSEYVYFPDRRAHRTVLRQIGAPEGSVVLRRNLEGEWRFDAATVERLPALAAQMKELPLVAGDEVLTAGDWIQERLPNWAVDGEILNLRYWQWLAIFLLILAGMVIDLVARAALRGFTHRFVDQFEEAGDAEQLRLTLRPIGMFAAACFWLLLLRFLGLDGRAFVFVEATLRIFLVLAGTLSAWRLTDLVSSVLVHRAARTTTKMDDVLVPLVRKSLKVFIVAIGLIYGADALQIPITPLLASLTVAGVGFSFAAKDTFENFFGSVAVLLDRPFDIGDWVKVQGIEGSIEEVGFRSTRIRTFYNSQITIPNSNLVRAVVDNLGRRRYRRWRTTLSVQYDTSPDKLVAFTEGIRELVRNHPYTRKDYYNVYCNEFSGSSLDILLYVFFDTPDWNTELRERERLFLDILRLADQLGVAFAFPTQTLHVAPPGPQGDDPVHDRPSSDAEDHASRRGALAAQGLVAEQPWREEAPAPVRVRRLPRKIDEPS